MATMEPVIELANKYANEISADVQELRQRVVAASEDLQQRAQQAQETIHTLEPQLKQTRDESLAALQDMGPVENLPAGKIFETFAWITVMQFGFVLASLAGSYALAPALALGMERFHGAIFAYAVLPYFFYQHLAYGESEADDVRRYHLLNFAMAEGVLVGFALRYRYLATVQPLFFVTPLCIGLVAQLVAPKLGSNRGAVFGACLGSAVGVHLLVGLMSGALSFPYLLLTLLYAGAGFATLQLFLKNNDRVHTYMFGYFVAAVLAQGLVFYLFGGVKETFEAD